MFKFSTVTTVLLLSTLSIANAWDSSENRIWLQGAVKGSLSETFSVKLTEQVRYIDETRFNYYRHTDFGITWTFTDNWSIEPMYRYILARNMDTKWYSTPVWGLNLRNKTSFSGVDIQTRLRLLYANLENGDPLSDFRPLISISPSAGWSAWKLKPFLSNEFIYSFDENLFYRNRLGGGLKITPVKPLSLSVFINQELTRDNDKNRWNERYNIGLTGQLTF